MGPRLEDLIGGADEVKEDDKKEESEKASDVDFVGPFMPNDPRHRKVTKKDLLKNNLLTDKELRKKRLKKLDKKRKQREASENAPKKTKDDDYISKYNKKFRSKALLDKHVSKKKRQATKKKKSGQSDKWKPGQFWDRDRDLLGRRMNSEVRQSVIQKAKKLDTRFQRGGK